MAALTRNRSIDQVASGFDRFQIEVDGAAAVIYEGAFVSCLSTGYAVDSDASGAGPVQGVAEHRVDNSAGADGALSVDVLQGQFWRPNSGTNACTVAHVGKPVFAEDDQTIGSLASAGVVVGICLAIDSTLGVLVYVNAALNAQIAAALSAQSTMPIPVGGNWHEVDGTALAAFSDGASNTPGLALDNSEAGGIRWNNAAAPDPICTTIAMPQDLDDGCDVVVHILASKSGATLADATTFDVGAFFQTVGALHDADADAGGTSSAMVGDATAKTVQEETVTIAAANVAASPSCLTLTLQPTDGTLGTDDVTVHAIWLEYTKKFLSA